MSDKTTRRQFLGKTTAGTAALAWAGGQLYAAGAEGSPGPAETVNLGLIGCGGRGGQLADSFYRKPGNRIVAVCDVDSERMGQARERLGGEKVQMYSDFRKMLESKDVDAVIVATPAIGMSCRPFKPVRPAKMFTWRSRWAPPSAKGALRLTRLVSTIASFRSAPNSAARSITSVPPKLCSRDASARSRK